MSRRGMVRLSTVLLAAGILCGCATLGRGETDAVMATVESWKDGILTQDLEQIMATYSDDYANFQQGDKAGARAFFAEQIENGTLDDAEVLLDYVEVTIEDGVALVSPVDLGIGAGYITLELTMKKEADGVWRIIASEAY